ncbi:tetratricopeptide repeat protein [Psychrobacter sp. Cmf 22.2]|uniref:tetratricopeptide repeat protein n=1 Tax=Psychrobacter sp. Cmf 22.2 TaxID=1926478 RepID=UPI0021171FA0|nr:tetratricopeptide repeat protein [Psychrobacter sp. Cmf 22.2]
MMSRLRKRRKLTLLLAVWLCVGTSAHANFVDTPTLICTPKTIVVDIDHDPARHDIENNSTRHATFHRNNTDLMVFPLNGDLAGTDDRAQLKSDLKVQTVDSTINTAKLPSATVLQPELREPSLYALLNAEFAADRGDIERALTLYKQQSFKEDATAVFERALSLSLRHDNVGDSLQFAKMWQDQNPDHVPAWFYVAHLALKAHDYTLAGQSLERILRYDPRTDLSDILIGIYPTTDSDQRELLEALQPINSEQNASLSVLKAGLLYQFNEPEIAIIHINRALLHQPDYVPFITLKADILRKTEPAETVLNYVNQARLRNPDSKSLYLYEIRYLLDLKQSQKALQLLLDAHQRFDDAEITLLAALVSLDNEEYRSADRLLNVLAKTPTYLDQAYYYLGISAERQQRFEQAKSYLKSVMQEDLVLAARKKVVDLELLDGNIDAAINTLADLRKQFTVFAPETYVLQANILWQHDQAEEALQLLTRVSRKYPNDQSILFARVQLLDDRSDYIIKRTLLNHLQALDPSNLSYQLSYAQLLLSNDQNSEQGLELAQNILQVRFDDPRYDNELHLQALNVLASSALANENYAQVIDYLKTPYDVLPTLRSGVLLLRAYQGLGESAKVNALLADLQQRFSFGQHNVNDRVQLY